ncbi:MAG: hypothetical protein EP343_09980 [Deltaproteobacteria bacterium]|nr:MAG: hypothetical protein EP343_09980 [Deltaproteobacteria bacterium]
MQRWIACLIGLGLLGIVSGCDCGPLARQKVPIQLELVTPKASQLVWERMPVSIRILEGEEDLSLVEFELSPVGKEQFRTIGSLPKPPYEFRWDSRGVPDGFYKLRVVGYDASQNAYPSRTILFQVHNAAPQFWFVNCTSGQWLRGSYPIVIDKQKEDPAWTGPPTVTLNGQTLKHSPTSQPPYRYAIDTEAFSDNDSLRIRATVKDVRGMEATIECRPQVDNTPPTLQFLRPYREGQLLGLRFLTQFRANDNVGTQRVQFWADSARCADPDPNNPTNPCSADSLWQSEKGPDFFINVALSSRYKAEPSDLIQVRLKAVAVDLAGNQSYPPTTMTVSVDTKPPEIVSMRIDEPTVLRTDQNQLPIVDAATKRLVLCTQVKDNRLAAVDFSIEGGKTPYLFPGKGGTTGTTVLRPVENFCLTIDNPIDKLGLGVRHFVVRAIDQAANLNRRRLAFRIGCSDSTDCPPDKVCSVGYCRTPAGLGQPCDAKTPCSVKTKCVYGPPEGQSYCSTIREGLCREPCNPGNKFLQPDSCSQSFFCSTQELACVPGDQCNPKTQSGCGATEQCLLKSNGASICVPVGPNGVGAECKEDCEVTTNCSRGSRCVLDLSSLKLSCRRYCQSDDNCPSNERCASVEYAFGGGKVAMGICLPK